MRIVYYQLCYIGMPKYISNQKISSLRHPFSGTTPGVDSRKRREAKEERKVETLLKQLVKKFGKIPVGYKENIKKLPTEKIDIISIEIFGMKELKDIGKYF